MTLASLVAVDDKGFRSWRVRPTGMFEKVCGNGRSSDDHRAAAPPLHIPRVGRDRAVEVLDGVRAAQLRVQHAVDAEALQGEGVVESFAHGGRRPGMVGVERGRASLVCQASCSTDITFACRRSGRWPRMLRGFWS